MGFDHCSVMFFFFKGASGRCRGFINTAEIYRMQLSNVKKVWLLRFFWSLPPSYLRELFPTPLFRISKNNHSSISMESIFTWGPLQRQTRLRLLCNNPSPCKKGNPQHLGSIVWNPLTVGKKPAVTGHELFLLTRGLSFLQHKVVEFLDMCLFLAMG